MKLTIEIANEKELEKVMTFFQSIPLENVRIIAPENTPSITRGDKKIDPNSLFGIWKDAPERWKKFAQRTGSGTGTYDAL